MKPLLLVLGLALLLATGSSLATAQSPAPAPDDEGTLITAQELENETVEDIASIRLVDVEQLLNSTRAEGTRQALKESDPAAIHEFLEGDSEVAKRIRDALREAGIAQDEAAALVRYEDQQLIVLYKRGS